MAILSMALVYFVGAFIVGFKVLLFWHKESYSDDDLSDYAAFGFTTLLAAAFWPVFIPGLSLARGVKALFERWDANDREKMGR